MWECEWYSLYKTDAPVRSYLQDTFPYKRSLNEEQLLQGIIDGKLFGYVQCDFDVPDQMRRYFSNFLLIVKKYVIGGEVIGTLMREDPEKEKIMAQPRRMLLSSLHLTNGTLVVRYFCFLESRNGVQTNLLLRSKQSQKVVQQFPTVCRECTTLRIWKSKLQCCHWDYETAS